MEFIKAHLWKEQKNEMQQQESNTSWFHSLSTPPRGVLTQGLPNLWYAKVFQVVRE